MSSARDPWDDARARHGKLASILRIIDRTKGEQEFVALPACPDYADLVLDGCTLIFPMTADPAERAAVIDQFDARYWEDRR